MSTGERVAATQSVIMELSLWPKPLEIDVCDEHYEIISAADALMSKFGRTSEVVPRAVRSKVTGGKRGPKTDLDLANDPLSMGCPECLKLYSGTGPARTKYLAQHIRVQHTPATIKDYTTEQLARATAEARDKITSNA
jgi:hypothetical protein